MRHEEALAWIRGERSTINYTDGPDQWTARVNADQRDAAMIQQAYWVLLAHHEGLIPEGEQDE